MGDFWGYFLDFFGLARPPERRRLALVPARGRVAVSAPAEARKLRKT